MHTTFIQRHVHVCVYFPKTAGNESSRQPTEERFERFGGYRISKDGTIDVDVLGEPVRLLEGEREVIRRACAGVSFDD